MNFYGVILFLSSVALQGHALHQGCANQEMCTEPNTYCSKGGFCVCKEGFHEIKIFYSYCISIPQEMGGICSEDAHCGGKAICNAKNKCECSEDHVPSPDGGHCLDYADTVGQECKTDQVCDRMENSECFSGHCVCQAGHVPSSNHSRCLKMAVRVTDPCEDSAQCITLLGEGNICRDGHCYCDFGLVSNQERNSCLPVVNQEGGPCQETSQCSAGLGPAKCSSAGRCQCLKNYIPNEGGDECILK